MRRRLRLAGCLLCLVAAARARADVPPDPLRLMPQQADFFLKIEQPRKLVEWFTQHPLVKQLQAIDAIREALESTNSRRFQQLLAYFENQLGADRLQLLDSLAGGGAVLGVKIGKDPGPVLLVVQGRDEDLLRRFFKLALDVLGQELARQEAKALLQRDKYREIEVVHLGKDVHAAIVGSALLLSNLDKAVQLAIDLHLDGEKKSLANVGQVTEARRLVGPDALGWMYLNLETVRKAPQAKEVFTEPRNDVNLTVLFGGILDVAQRAPFLAAGLYATPSELALSFRMPRGHEGKSSAISTHIPPADQVGSRPLLEPKGVLLSTSYYLDLAKFWENRGKLFNEKQRKAFEDFDKTSATFLAGTPFSKLVSQVGPYQRFIIAHQPHVGYKTTPEQRIPAFALVVEVREPAPFSKRMDAILRAAALLATTQVKLKPFEETHGGLKIVGYRFPEDGSYKQDTTNYRFNFSPCFVEVGNQFLACSTIELCRDMVDLLEREGLDKSKNDSPAATRTRIYAQGGADLLETFKDRLFAQVFLNQALVPEKANEQVRTILDLVRRLGIFQIEENYGAHDFHFDLRLRLGE